MSRLFDTFTALHQIPELGYLERKTQQLLLRHLSKLSCVIHEVGTALVCYFDLGKTSTIALRCEMDGLLIEETTNLWYASKHMGYMHACGHDGHMAMLLELAYLLEEGLDSFYNVVLIFQSAEELSGGAMQIVESGWLARYYVQAVFGMHLWPGLEKGKLFSREGALLAGSMELTINIIGKSAHAANAIEGCNAMLAGAELVLNGTSLKLPIRCHFGIFNSGKTRNIVADTTCLEGTLRYFIQASKEQYISYLEKLISYLDIKYQTQTKLIIHPCNEVVYNHQGLYNHVMTTLDIKRCEPYYQAEDFGAYAMYPSLFLLLGIGKCEPLHSANFTFDYEVLEQGVAFYKALLMEEDLVV